MNMITTKPAAKRISYDEYVEALLTLVEQGLNHDTMNALATIRSAQPIFIWDMAMAAFYAMTGDARELAFVCGDIVVDIGNGDDRPDAEEPGPVGWLALGWMLAERERHLSENDPGRIAPQVLERLRAYLREIEKEFRSRHAEHGPQAAAPAADATGKPPLVAPGEREFDGITLASLRELGGRVHVRFGEAAVVEAITRAGGAKRMTDVELHRYPSLRDQLLLLLLQDTPPRHRH